MKKHLKKIAVAMVIAAGLFTWATAYSTVVPAFGCRYTGYSGDYCKIGSTWVYSCSNSNTTTCAYNQ